MSPKMSNSRRTRRQKQNTKLKNQKVSKINPSPVPIHKNYTEEKEILTNKVETAKPYSTNPVNLDPTPSEISEKCTRRSTQEISDEPGLYATEMFDQNGSSAIKSFVVFCIVLGAICALVLLSVKGCNTSAVSNNVSPSPTPTSTIVPVIVASPTPLGTPTPLDTPTVTPTPTPTPTDGNEIEPTPIPDTSATASPESQWYTIGSKLPSIDNQPTP